MKKIENLKLKIGTFLGQLEIRSIRNSNAGFSIIEVILATALFMILATASITTILQGLSSNRLGKEQTVANQYAAEGIEAVRSIKNQGFSNLVNDTETGVVRSGGNVWAFNGQPNNTNIFNPVGKYTRAIKVEDVQRDCSLNIVGSGGSIDPLTKKITSTVSWNFTPSRANSVQLSTYLSDWKKTIPVPGTLGGGMLVYGDGGTSNNAIRYRVLDPTTGIWSTTQYINSTFNGSSTDELRSIRLYSSSQRNEKIAISRHLGGTSSQTIWAHVWDGTSFTSTQLSSFTSNSALDVRNFDGDYLNNGDFLAVYSDNTSTMKYQIWDGQCWSAKGNLQNLADNNSGIPLYIIAKTRPDTNEMMVVSFGVAQDTNTQYFNGTSWALHQRHSARGPANKEMIDFAWSPNSSITGALVYPASATDRNITIKIWTADGGGSGLWSSAANTSNQGTLGAMNIDGSFGRDEFLACSKDASNDIYCFKSTFTPSWQTPTNNILTTTTQNGIQRSYDFVFESLTGTNGLAVYSINSNAPQRRIYTPGASPSFSTAANLLTTQLGGTLTTVRTRSFRDNDDIMVLMGDSLNRLYTVIWNGNANGVYTTPLGKARTQHGTSGSATIDYWYDFAWDKF